MEKSFLKTDSGAVINSDLSEYERYKLKRQQAVREKSLQEKVESLEKELNDLKSRLYQLENRLN